jgi:hypothetical protein
MKDRKINKHKEKQILVGTAPNHNEIHLSQGKLSYAMMNFIRKKEQHSHKGN